MPIWLVNLIVGIAGPLLKIFIQTPPPVAVEAEKLGETEAALSASQAANKDIADAKDASNSALLAAVADPGSLRQPAPDSRD